jgi:hypothetical protein
MRLNLPNALASICLTRSRDVPNMSIPVGFLLLIYHMVILIAVEYKKNPDKEIAP